MFNHLTSLTPLFYCPPSPTHSLHQNHISHSPFPSSSDFIRANRIWNTQREQQNQPDWGYCPINRTITWVKLVLLGFAGTGLDLPGDGGKAAGRWQNEIWLGTSVVRSELVGEGIRLDIRRTRAISLDVGQGFAICPHNEASDAILQLPGVPGYRFHSFSLQMRTSLERSAHGGSF